MHIEKTKLKGLVILRSTVHDDRRGFFKEIYKNKILKKNLIFDCLSHSKKNTIRGLHFQKKNPQGKFITVVEGEILDVAVDLRKKSKTFGKYFSIQISQNDDFSFFIPENFAHGFLCLSNTCTVNYKCSNYRNSKYEKTLAWNDKSINIKWPIKKPILSEKDKNNNQTLKDIFNF